MIATKALALCVLLAAVACATARQQESDTARVVLRATRITLDKIGDSFKAACGSAYQIAKAAGDTSDVLAKCDPIIEAHGKATKAYNEALRLQQAVDAGSAAVTQLESALTDAQGALAALILLRGEGL